MHVSSLGQPPAATAPSTRRPGAGDRSLAPREHGAYGQLGLPLVTALCMGRPGASAVLLAVASLAGFLAHEPLLLVTGQRGSRAAREVGARAYRRLAWLGAIMAIAGGLGFLLAPPAARLAVILPLGLAALLTPFILRKQEKTAAGELIAAAALSSAAVPIAFAAEVPAALVWSAWLSWCLVLGASTLAVRSVIAHARAPLALGRRLVLPILALVAGAAVAASGWLTPPAALGALPMLGLALGLAAQPPSPRSLKKVGWGLVASSVLLGAALVVGAHV
ncbi:MAG: YwiC-like family protein [Byssovorax sp.]